MIKLLKYISYQFTTKRLNVFILFFVAAFSILIISKLSMLHRNTIIYNIELTSVPKDIIVTNPEDLKLRVSLETTGFSWLNFVFKTPIVSFDVNEDFKQEANLYQLNNDKVLQLLPSVLPKDYKNLEVQTEKVTIEFDQLSTKLVPVKQLFDISFENGFNTNEVITINPDSVTVIGSIKLLEAINEIETEPLILEGLNTSIKQTISLKLDDLPVAVNVSSKVVELNLNVEPFTEGKLKVPIIIKNLPLDTSITFFPKEATVNYYVPLTLYNTISVTDFEVICDYKKLSNSGNMLFPELNILNIKVKTARIKERNVEFILTN